MAVSNLYREQLYHKSWGMPHSPYMEQNVQIARRAVRKRFQNVSYEDLDQELYLKAIQFDEMDHIERPALVMKSMLNHVTDIVRKETMYRRKFDLGREDSEELMNLMDAEFSWTPRLLGASLVAFILHPQLLPPIAKDEVYSIYKIMTRGEHLILLSYIFEDRTEYIRTAYSRVYSKYYRVLEKV